MRTKVIVIDTSILCVWLKVTDFECCGPDDDKWDYERVNIKIEKEKQEKTTFVLPLATIIETGNHIAHARGDRHHMAISLYELVVNSVDEKTPWATFSKQENLWKGIGIRSLVDRWKEVAKSGQSIGDTSIIDVANLYKKMGFEVEILTGDIGLKAYQPSVISPEFVPRRKKIHR